MVKLCCCDLQVLLDNVKRVTNIFHTIISTVEFVKSTWSWENKVISAVSFLVSK